MATKAANCSCCQCKAVLVVLRWRNGRKILVAECPNCNEEMIFDLETALRVLGVQQPNTESIVLTPMPEGLM